MLKKSIQIVGIGGSLREHSTSLSALRYSLDSAKASGADVQLLSLSELDLPIYNPLKSIADYGKQVRSFVGTVREADGLIWSAPAYHGTISGAFKNALDFLQFLAKGESAYLSDRPVGLISTAGGHVAAANAINAMVHAAHALRATPIPLQVPLGESWRYISDEGSIVDVQRAQRLEQLGRHAADSSRRAMTYRTVNPGESEVSATIRASR